MKITWYGTACVKMESDGQSILFDPYVRRYASTANGGAEKRLRTIFEREKHILVTHGHFDHIADMGKLYGDKENVHIYATKTPLHSLQRDGVPSTCFHRLQPDERFSIGGFAIQTWKGKHIHFNAALVWKTASNRRLLLHPGACWWFLTHFHKYRENGEILFYEITVENKLIQLIGSAALHEQVQYSQHADLLIMAYQGRSDLPQYALRLVERLKPKKIMLSHFDDAFPPLSSEVDVNAFYQLMKDKYPEIEVMIPQLDVSYQF